MYAYYRHIGDYHRDAGFLTALQHGIYTLLLDHYYAQERPIPDAAAHLVARSPREDVQPVLDLFFTLNPEDGCWHHRRIDAEIAEYRARADTARENGKNGGRPRKDGSPPRRAGDNPPEPTPVPTENPAGSKSVKRGRKARKGLGEDIPVPPGLQRFLDAYPKGKRNKLVDVVKVWEGDELEEFADVIVRDVEKRKAMHWTWIKDGGAFIPGAQVYLNGKRWNDDIEPMPTRLAGNRRQALEDDNARAARDWADGERA
jgi:uncharacterized protein YdaU (DUF1376 family)